MRLLAKGDDWQTLVYPEITPTIQGVVQQIINCPYHGVTKRMYLQAKVLELMTLQLTPILAYQEGLQPSPRLKSQTIARIQNGDFKGLGFGLGLFYVGTRAGDLDNSFKLPDYLRTDAAIYYRRDALKAAINIRNLFDTEYYSSSGGLRTFVRTGAPFTIIGSISWEF
ncbi:hypothetical protein [Nostoc sp. NOS(2021)]|uniref:hypothetical protein n=1 Tax=Nostoc sp. NOS(2021) TaxID=2815407 RepID=UPI003457CBA7